MACRPAPPSGADEDLVTRLMIAVHVTHEAVEKMGGIGAVIAGLATSRGYRDTFERSILIGPLLPGDRPAPERLGPGGKVLYSSLDGVDEDAWAGKFARIERSYDVRVLYGTRRLTNGQQEDPAEVEVLLVDVFRCNQNRLNLFKAQLYQRFAVPSDRFEHIWEFEEYIRLAEPAWEAAVAIGAGGAPRDPVVLFSHEYMGLPTALKATLDARAHVRTVFYAHEVASARPIVEQHPAHDLMFYNLLAAAEKDGASLEEFFPESPGFFKHPLIKAARHLDVTFAVGGLVGREMRFLDRSGAAAEVEAVYNGVPAGRQTLPQRRAHRDRMRQYARALFAAECDYVFTHVARPVLSKGIWRDLRVLHEMEPLLAAGGKTAVFFMLGTLAGQRRTRDVLHMERVTGWPVHHRLGYPDLCNGEETLGDAFEDFNRHHRAVRVVLVNQFGWERRLCGSRMPAEMTLADIRRGTDVEFGMSVYEPFGISQLECLSFGAICLLSSVCGCLDLLGHCAPDGLPDNVLVGDFVRLAKPVSVSEAIGATRRQRDAVEAAEGKRLAGELMRRLPQNDDDMAELLRAGWELARQLDWERVVEEFFLPAVRRTGRRDELNGLAT